MRRARLISLILLLSVVDARPLGAQETSAFKVIVNSSSPIHEVERDFLSRAFQKKITRWPDGEMIHPVDRAVDSQVRKRFDLEVLGRPAEAVRYEWEQAIFSGRSVPPPEFNSDAEVVAYVAKNPGAVGYVSAAAEINGNKAVSVK